MLENIPFYGAFPDDEGTVGLGAVPRNALRGIRASVGIGDVVGVAAGEGVLSDTTQTGQALADYLSRTGIATACNSWTQNGEFANLTRQFQQAFGGTVDGQYGPDTAGALATVVGTHAAPPGCARFGGSAGGVTPSPPPPPPPPPPAPAPTPTPLPAPKPPAPIVPVVIKPAVAEVDNTMWWVLGGALLLGGGAYLYTQKKKGTVSTGTPTRRFMRRR